MLSEWIVAGPRTPEKYQPPDRENGSPDAVGTATGAEIQSATEGTSKNYRRANEDVQSAAALSTGTTVPETPKYTSDMVAPLITAGANANAESRHDPLVSRLR